MFIELHMIQNFAPSNLNRDDTGNPKDCEFGGHRRARISSQCIKRSIRLHPAFAQTTQVPIGERTKWMTRWLAQPLEAAGKSTEEAQRVAQSFAVTYAGKMDPKNTKKTAVLLYLSPNELEIITDQLLDHWKEVLAESDSAPKNQKRMAALVKEVVKLTKGRTGAPDIALFGRMLANEPKLNLDAASQVAHAISTHRVNMEMDYYTAVDDLSRDDEAGAAMVGFTGFNSACFYRYARIDWRQLLDNLDGDVQLARRTIEGFLRASVAAIPSGKQSSFAAQNPPSFLLATVRSDGLCWSMVNAFERPVRPGHDSGYVAPSILALDSYWADLNRVYGNGQSTAASLLLDDQMTLPHLQDTVCLDLSAWIATVLAALPKE